MTSTEYSARLAALAESILYRSPLPVSPSAPSPTSAQPVAGTAVYVLNTAALPDTRSTNYDQLLPYVLARLPGEDELVGGTEYEIVIFAGGRGERGEGRRPGWGWLVQAYAVLSRAMRKRLRRLYVVHEKGWVRVLVEMFSTVVSPKFRRKIVHAATISNLALHIPIENLLIPPSAYLLDRKHSPSIFAPMATGRRAFAAPVPFPSNFSGDTRLPRVLREVTSFILMDGIIQTEGIFRVSPPVNVRTIVREAYDRGQKFIIWKEGERYLPLPEYPGTVGASAVCEETTREESYGPHVAAGVLKLWYSELRNPIVPEAAYKEITDVFSGPKTAIPTIITGQPNGALDKKQDILLEDLIDFLSPGSEVSPLAPKARMVLTRHLLPLLYAVSSQSHVNLMTPENLAVCFAPTLMCGRNQMDDIRMTNVLKKVLGAAVEHWPTLRDVFGITEDAFFKALEAPPDWDDYEDPLDTPMEGYPAAFGIKGLPVLPKLSTGGRLAGIVLKDNDPGAHEYDSDAEEVDVMDVDMQSVGVASPLDQSPIAPPLPPRSMSQERPSSLSRSGPKGTPPLLQRAFASPLKQPAPPTSDPFTSTLNTSSPSSISSISKLRIRSHSSDNAPQILPPRYSVVVGDVSDSPSSYVAADGFGPPRRSGFSFHESDNAEYSPAIDTRPTSFAPSINTYVSTAATSTSGRESPTSMGMSLGSVRRKPVGSGPPSRDGSEGGSTGLGFKMDVDPK